MIICWKKIERLLSMIGFAIVVDELMNAMNRQEAQNRLYKKKYTDSV